MNAFPPGFRRGVQHFNAGRYFEAHEAFEDVLDEVEEDARWDFVLALVQVAVGYHKWTSRHPGAARMLGLGAEKLAAFPPDAWGIDLEALRRRIATDTAAAERGRLNDAPPLILPTRP
jgi:predicted metal-dependent hydrolase